MAAHEQFGEDLALHALGALHGSEKAVLEAHLQECAACRRELEDLRGDMALMALSAAGPKPPARSRTRLLEAVAREPRRQAERGSSLRRGWWRMLPMLTSAAAAILIIVILGKMTDLRNELVRVQGQSAQTQIELQRAKEIAATLTAPDAVRVTLVAAKTPPQPQGKAIYVRDRASLIFIASNFGTLPAGKAYELWIIPTQGNPIPAGVFKPDANGSGTIVNPPIPSNVEAKAFAITVEPEAGSAAPTSAPIMLGAGE